MQGEIDMPRGFVMGVAAGGLTLACACSGQGGSSIARVEDIAALQITDARTGAGAEAVAGREVTVHYTGWLYVSGAADHRGRKFDSSRDRGEAFTFRLGAGDVIGGWDQGVAGMKVGGVRTLAIPSAQAYGAEGAPGAIPPNAALLFEIELLGVR
jgi:FKBP-type peptidyl-prolyl cis-trans isomerase FkpA